jgi:alcohol dehydrogenase YqhD (iron-dependent ADH family)
MIYKLNILKWAATSAHNSIISHQLVRDSRLHPLEHLLMEFMNLGKQQFYILMI